MADEKADLLPSVNTALDAVMGLALGGYEDSRQLKQQGKLQNQAMYGPGGYQDQSNWNQKKAMEMWEATGYGAQRRQLEEAGLNVGLMYGQAGGGGTTQGAGANAQMAHATPTQGQAGMAMQLGLQKAMTEAQIKLAETQAKKNEAEATKIAGADTTLATEQANQIKQLTTNYKIQESLLNFQKQIGDATTTTTIDQIKSEARKAEGEARSAQAKGEIDDVTQQNVINYINRTVEEQDVRIKAVNAGLVKTGAEVKAINAGIQKIGAEIKTMLQTNQQNWDKLSIAERELIVKQAMAKLQGQTTEFNTSTPEQIKQWTGIITQFIPFAGNGGSKIGFKY